MATDDFAWNIVLILLRTTLFLSLAAALVLLVLRLFRISSPAVVRACWVLVLAVGWSFARFEVPVAWYEPPRAATASVATTPATAAPALDVVSAASDAQPPLALEASVATFAAPPPAAFLPAPAAVGPVDEPRAVTWARVLAAAWGVGILGCLLAGVVGYARFVWNLPKPGGGEEAWQRQWREMVRRQGIQTAIPLRVTAHQGPALCRLPKGYELLVPAGLWSELDAAARQAILRHELAHYQRGDVWKSLAARLLALPHWFNPLAWLAVRRFEEAAEWACDRAASGDGPATAYAKTLMRLGEAATRPALYGKMAGGRTLAARIRRLLAPPSEDSLSKTSLVVAAAIGAATLAVVRVELVAKEPPSSSPPASYPAAEAPSEPQENPAAPATPPSGPPATKANGPTVSPYLNLLHDQKPQPSVAGSAGLAQTPKNVARRKAIEKMVSEAKTAYEATWEAFKTDMVTIDGVHYWSLTWMAAAVDAAGDLFGKRKAVEAHLERMKELQAHIKVKFDLGARGGELSQMAAANYYVAEAERKLVEIEPPAVAGGGGSPPLSITASGNVVLRDGVTLQSSTGKATAGAVSYPNPEADKKEPSVKAAGSQGRYGGTPDKPANLLYDGKAFADWAKTLQTDLSPDRRRQAVFALAEFGAHGQGRAAAKEIIAMMDGYAVDRTNDGSPESMLIQVALGAIKKIPLSESRELLEKAAREGTGNQKGFALTSLALVAPPSEAQPILLAALDDPDLHVRMAARAGASVVARSAPELAESLRKALTEGERAERLQAMRLVQHAAKLPSVTVAPASSPLADLYVDVGRLMTTEDEVVRKQAEGELLVDPNVEAALERAANKGNQQAAEVLNRLQNLKRDRERAKR